MDRTDLITKDVDDCSVIYATGYLNGLSAEKLEYECDNILKKGIKKVVLDFNNIELINSIGISVLIGIIEKLKKIDGHLCFCNLHKIHSDTFEILGLTKYVPIFASESEAITSFRDR